MGLWCGECKKHGAILRKEEERVQGGQECWWERMHSYSKAEAQLITVSCHLLDLQNMIVVIFLFRTGQGVVTVFMI